VSTSAFRSKSATSAAIWLAVGAAAGVLVGVAAADRLGGGHKLLGRFRGMLALVEGWTSARNASDTAEDEEDDYDDEDEDNDETEEDDEDEEVLFDADLDDEEDLITEVIVSESSRDGDDPLDGDDFLDEATRIDVRVLAAFEQDPVLSNRMIEIDEPEPATIVLAGRVPTAEEAAHALTIARGVPGVVRVQNNLRVRRAPAS
jgi:hypothetical protein